MPAAMTRFRLSPHGRGLPSLLSGFRALAAVLPNAQVEAVLLDGERFPIDTRCFPDSVWARLVANPDWHPRLMEQLHAHLRESDPAKKRLLQARFLRRLQAPYVRTALLGRMPFDADGTPGWLKGGIIPRLKELGCRLSVADPAMHRPPEDPQLWKLQVQFWEDQRLPYFSSR